MQAAWRIKLRLRSPFSRSKLIIQPLCRLSQAVNPPYPPRSTLCSWRLVSLERIFYKVCHHVAEAKCQLGDAEDTVRDHSASLHTLQVDVKLESRAEDAENHNRRNNLRIIALPQGSEGPDPSAYTERLLHMLFPQADFSSFFAIERVHRMPPACSPPRAPPHTFIFRRLNFRDQDLILREACKMELIRHETARW